MKAIRFVTYSRKLNAKRSKINALNYRSKNSYYIRAKLNKLKPYFKQLF